VMTLLVLAIGIVVAPPAVRSQIAQRSRFVVAQQQDYAQELPAGWQLGFDQTSGATYYINEQTGISQWEPPANDPASQVRSEAQDLPAGWTIGFDPTYNAHYYINEQTGQCQWEPPQPSQHGFNEHTDQNPGRQSPADQNPVFQIATATQQGVVCTMKSATGWGPRFAGKYKLRNGDEEILGRYDMDLQKPYRPWVSREQCVVRVSPDGAVTLTSRSQYVPTLWRQPGGSWVALYRDDALTLSDGDHVGLDCNDPEGTVFVCTLEGATQQGDHTMQQGRYHQQGGYTVQPSSYPQQGVL